MKEKQLWVPVDRFLSVVGDRTLNDDHPQARGLRELRAGRRQFVSLDVADKILVELDLQHFWHITRADGGLADIYRDGEQYGTPLDTSGLRRGSSPERLEARRRAWREFKERARKDPVRLEAMRASWRESKRRAKERSAAA